MTLELIIPQATTNLITNPSFEVDTAGYAAAAGGTLSRVVTQQRRGIASGEYIPTAVIDDGPYWSLSLGLGTDYTFSLDVLIPVGVRWRIYAYDAVAGITLTGTTDFVGTGLWQRPAVSFRTGSNASIRLYLVKNGDASTATIYTDGWQVEQGDETTYCDGNQPGCAWVGQSDATISHRSGQSRAGGLVIDLSDYNIAVTELYGLDATPLQHNVMSLATQPGALLNSIKVLPRTIQLVSVTETDDEAAMYAALADLRQSLEATRYRPLQPIPLRYTRNDKLVEIAVYYEGGMEGAFIEHCYTRFTARFQAYEDPYWKEIGNVAQELDTLSSFNNNYLFRFHEGHWEGVGPAVGASAPPSSSLYFIDLKYDGRNRVYIAGAFANWNGVAGQNWLVYYDLSTGLYGNIGIPNNAVLDMAVRPNGNVVIVGLFTSVDGVAADYIAEWDYATDTWSEVGGGAGAGVENVFIDTDGQIYVAGGVTSLNGSPAVVGRWNGTAWTILAPSATGSIDALAVGVDGYVYVGGNVGVIDGVSVTRVARRNPNTAAWDDMNGGSNSSIYSIARGPDGLIYFLGDFTSIGGLVVNYVAVWNGVQFAQMGDTRTNGAGEISFDQPHGRVWTSVEGLWPNLPFARYIARGTKNAWLSVDLDMTVLASAIQAPPLAMARDDLYMVFKAAGAHRTSGFTTLTNEGEVPTYPKITIQRTGGTSAQLVLIRNNTTGDELFFDIDILDGETITIDLTRADKKLSSDWRGLGFASYLPGSNVSSFALLPGDNDIAMFVYEVGAPTVQAFAQWRVSYAGVSGAA